jgi:addiction module HigA family antidote
MHGQSSTGHGDDSLQPGRRLRDALRERDWSETKLAWALGYSTIFVRNLLDKPALTPQMALRLEAALGIQAEDWIHFQHDHDLWWLRERMEGELAMIRKRARHADSFTDHTLG